MIDRRVGISQSGSVWLLLAGFAVGLYLLWQLSFSIASGGSKLALLFAAAFAAFFVAARIANDWRSGVYYFLGWLLFEDLVRKYLGNNMTVYFAKDVLLALTYASFVIARKKEDSPPFHPAFRFAFVAFFILGLAQVFNPLSPSIFYGLLGLKLYFYYVPLMFVGYALIRDENDLPRFFAINMVLAGVIAAIGIIQTFFGLNFLNPRTEGSDIDELGHMTRYTHEGLALVRAPSVFVSEGRFGSFMFIGFIVGMAGAGYLLLRSKRGRIFVFPGLGLVAIGGIMTGSRGAVVYLTATAVLLSAGMLWGAPPGKAAAYRLVKAIRRSFIFIAAAMWLAIILLPGVMVPRFTFYQETLNPNSQYFEAGYRTWNYPAQELMKAFADPAWMTGHGIGTASLGVQYVSRIMEVPSPAIGVENGYGILILELGILGPILWLLWATSLVAAAIKTALRVKGTWAFPIALATTWFAFVLLFQLTWGSLVQFQNFVTNAYFWLFVGILFRLPELVRKSEVADQERELARVI